MSAGVMTVERLTEDGLHFLEEPSGEYERIVGLLNMTFIKMRAMSKEQGIWYDSRGRKGSLIRSDKQMIQKQARKKRLVYMSSPKNLSRSQHEEK